MTVTIAVLPIPFAVYRDMTGAPQFTINDVSTVDKVLVEEALRFMRQAAKTMEDMAGCGPVLRSLKTECIPTRFCPRNAAVMQLKSALFSRHLGSGLID
jgi:hypothetical protein